MSRPGQQQQLGNSTAAPVVAAQEPVGLNTAQQQQNPLQLLSNAFLAAVTTAQQQNGMAKPQQGATAPVAPPQATAAPPSQTMMHIPPALAAIAATMVASRQQQQTSKPQQQQQTQQQPLPPPLAPTILPTSSENQPSPHTHPLFYNRPLRSGKWIPQEEEYATLLMELFDAGAVTPPLANGATLRLYLSRMLHCSPMRISKKYAGKGIGKRVYIDNSNSKKQNMERRELLEQVQRAQNQFVQAVAAWEGYGVVPMVCIYGMGWVFFSQLFSLFVV